MSTNHQTPIRLLITASTLPRYLGDKTVDFVWQQARYFKKHYPNMEIHVLAPHDQGAALREEWEGVQIHRYRYFWPVTAQKLVYPAIWPNIKANPWLLFQIPFLFLSLFWAARKVVQQERINLVYSHWFTPQGVICHLIAKWKKIPHVLTSHAADIIILKKLPWLGKKIVQRVLPQFEVVTFAGSRGMNQALEFFQGLPIQPQLQQKFSVLPMGVDLPAAPATEQPKATHTESLKLLFVGRFAEKKGIKYLLEAMAQVQSQGIAVQLDLLGDGPLKEEIAQQVVALGLQQQVSFRGFVNGVEKSQYLQQADLFMLPSIVTDDGDAEGLPVSLLEAMASGALCCATDESGAPDIVTDGVNALLCRAKSSEALADIMLRVQAMNESYRGQIREQARACGESYLWDNMIHRHYQTLIESVSR